MRFTLTYTLAFGVDCDEPDATEDQLRAALAARVAEFRLELTAAAAERAGVLTVSEAVGLPDQVEVL